MWRNVDSDLIKILVLCLFWMKVDSNSLNSFGSVFDLEEGGFRLAKKCWFCACFG